MYIRKNYVGTRIKMDLLEYEKQTVSKVNKHTWNFKEIEEVTW